MYNQISDARPMMIEAMLHAKTSFQGINHVMSSFEMFGFEFTEFYSRNNSNRIIQLLFVQPVHSKAGPQPYFQLLQTVSLLLLLQKTKSFTIVFLLQHEHFACISTDA